MKKTVLIIIISIYTLYLCANPVDEKTALTIAKNYSNLQSKSSTTLTLVYKCVSDENNKTKKQIYYYIFNSNNGFIIVSGEDATYPILGYSNTTTFDAKKMPGNFKFWIENYKKQIKYIITNKIKATKQIKKQWLEIKSKSKSKSKKTKNIKSVSPLITTNWGQIPYENAQCPYDTDAGYDYGYHAPAGCAATAMAQIMKFWNYPGKGTGFHSYLHPKYGTLFANFSETSYDWTKMPDQVNSPNEAVATLTYHCGVATEMSYGPVSSNTFMIMDGFPDEKTCEYAYKTYFDYDPVSLKGIWRKKYSDTTWKQLLKKNIDERRPIQYAGYSSVGFGGHTFVCDGYDNNDNFHINWGWSGYCNGYFIIDALNPNIGGTGAGNGNFNSNQHAIIGIQPNPINIYYPIRKLLFIAIQAY